MTSQVSDVLIRVRDSLSDPEGTRWSDARLIRLIDEAQTAIVKEAQLLRSKTTVSIIGLQNEYVLPDEAYLITRVVDAKGKRLNLVSHGLKDNSEETPGYQEEWEFDTSTEISTILFDLLSPRTFKVYPIPIESDGGETFITSDYGVTTDIESDVMTGDFGVVVSVSGDATNTVEFNSDYGIVTAMSSDVERLTVYYRRKPVKLTAVTDFLETDPIHDAALKFYIVGMALMDDQDTQNIAAGKNALTFYASELGIAVKHSKKDNKSTSIQASSYNRAI